MSNSLSKYKPIDDMTKPLHITLAIPRTLKGVGANVLEEINYTYYQSVCSCGWHGDYKVSKLTAQEDKCPNR